MTSLESAPVSSAPTPPARSARRYGPLCVGPLRVDMPVELAPMAGVTNASFRRLCRESAEAALPQDLACLCTSHEGPIPADNSGHASGNDAATAGALRSPAGLYVTEMVTTRALVEGNEKTLAMVRTAPGERIRSIQLYGVDPTIAGQAVTILVERDIADHIDLNFGCPAPKVTRKGGGAALPWKRDLFEAIVRQCVQAAETASRRGRRDFTVPVTVKMRKGIDDEHLTYMDAARIATNAGVSALALHGRTAREHYSGHAHWEDIARLKELTHLPVLGNGDIWSGDDALRMMEQTGADGVVVGRGCQGRPWLFADIIHAMSGSDQRTRPDLDAVIATIVRHGELLADEMGENRGIRDLRKHIGWYLKGYPVGGSARAELMRVDSLESLHAGLRAMRERLPEEVPYPSSGVEGPRGRAGTPKRPHLPDGWLDSPLLTPEQRVLVAGAESDISGG